MKVSPISFIAILLLVMAIAIAGCTSTQTSTTPSGVSGPATSATGGGAVAGSGGSSGSQSSGSAAADGSMVSGSDLFKGLSYTWVEYHLYQGSVAAQQSSGINTFVRFEKGGKCTMRSVGGTPQSATPSECAGTGVSTTETDPNKAGSGAEISCSATDESVTTPAGTFTATKCTVTAKQKTSTVWVEKGNFVVKKEWNNAGILWGMELNANG